MSEPDSDLVRYLDAALALHGLVLDETRRRDVEKQLRLLEGMARLIEDFPLAADVEPANIFRP